jgi:hypothetical protein
VLVFYFHTNRIEYTVFYFCPVNSIGFLILVFYFNPVLLFYFHPVNSIGFLCLSHLHHSSRVDNPLATRLREEEEQQQREQVGHT